MREDRRAEANRRTITTLSLTEIKLVNEPKNEIFEVHFLFIIEWIVILFVICNEVMNYDEVEGCYVCGEVLMHGKADTANDNT